MTEKIAPTSSWNLKPTPRQVIAITKLCIQLGISEPLEERPSNRWEARNLLYDLRQQQKGRG